VFVRARARVGGQLQFAISGAAALGLEVAELIDGIGITVYEGYGLTEASPIVAANVPGQRKLGSVGRPLPGVHVTIDRAAVSNAATGSRGDGDGGDGEIVVYGPNVMRGYHDRPADNRAARTPDGGLRTGDVGYLDADGYLYVTGRIKEQYKLDNGRYVSPAPLEDQLKLSPLIANVLIHGHNRPHNVALVVPGGEIAGSADARARIRAEIDRLSAGWKPFERVTAFALVDEDFTQTNDMLTPSLKIKRRNVVRRYQSTIDALYEKVG
jgi:long-chain acyl-CoA synthetase